MTIIKPQPGPQEMFLSTTADICIYGGAAGGGKTFGLLMEPLRHIGNDGFRNRCTAERFYDPCNFPCGYTAHDHFRHGRDQSSFAAGIVLKDHRMERLISVSRYIQRYRSDSRFEISGSEAVSRVCTAF